MEVAPTSAMPELPGVKGSIMRMARMSWITNDSKKSGGWPRPMRIRDAVTISETQ